MATGGITNSEHLVDLLNQLEEEKPDTFRFVVAIDFGTSYSGFAFKLSNTENINVQKIWGDQSQHLYKTPTCILFKEDGSFDKFGEEAQREYIEMSPDEARKVLYFEKFKMKLLQKYYEQPLTRESTLRAANGKRLPALKVFAGALAFMKNTFKDGQQTSTLYTPEDREILWVVTVPAIWDDAAKRFMREASVKAGLIDFVNSKRLRLALEPEAAGVLCTQLPVGQFVDESSERELGRLGTGDTYMVVDCGGGTIDIAVHEILASGGIKQKHIPRGGPWGGENVNDAFFDLLKDIYSPELINNFISSDPQAWFEFCKAFESVKRNFRYRTLKPLRISPPQELCRLICETDAQQHGIEPHESNAVKELVDRHKQRTGDNVEYSRSNLLLGFNVAKELFDTSINPLVTELTRLFREPNLATLSRVFVVGGFADCLYLQARVKECAPRGVECLVPRDAGESVMRGAVMFGSRPQIIEERVAGATYGFKLAEAWNKEKFGRRPDLKVRVQGQYYCRDVLVPFLKEGDTVQLNEKPRLQLVKPIDKDTNEIFVELFVRRGYEEVMFTDERCSGVGRIRVTLQPLPHTQCQEQEDEKKTESENEPEGREGAEENRQKAIRECALGFVFTQTEIRALALDIQTGNCETKYIDFLQSEA